MGHSQGIGCAFLILAVGCHGFGLRPARDAQELALPEHTSASIEVGDLRAHVRALASDETEGRLTGTRGERVAASYIGRAFQALGLEPAGDAGSYFQDFGFTAGVSLGDDNHLSVVLEQTSDAQTEHRFELERDWRPLAFSRVGDIPASAVAFAGYGIVSPAHESVTAIDSYTGLDVRDHWVLIFRFVPAELSGRTRQHLNRFSSLRYKAMIARERGARGILVVSGPRSEVREELVKLRFDASLAGTSIAAVSLSNAAASLLVEASGHDLASLQTRLDTGEQIPGFIVEGTRLAAHIDLRQERRTGRNVLAAMRADESSGAAVLIGAHADHLGRGEAGSSLARKDELGQVHYGADDNASGVAAMLEVAQWLLEQRDRGELELQRDILFAAWSGEELGLLGANHFATELRSDPHGSTPTDLSSEIAAYLNLDMVGRSGGRLTLYGVGSSSIWAHEIERANAGIGLSIGAESDAYLPTDSTIFFLKGVPILSAFTGSHEDYHTPRDRPEHLDYEGLGDVSQLVAAIATSLATRGSAPDYIPSPPPAQGIARSGLRVYLGTMPDYSATADLGLRLSGVVKSGPAEAAGMRENDLVVEVDGRTIENIYDYTYALDALRVGVSAEIVVVRDGERVKLEVVPTSRD